MLVPLHLINLSLIQTLFGLTVCQGMAKVRFNNTLGGTGVGGRGREGGGAGVEGAGERLLLLFNIYFYLFV